ncbi:calcineurin-like phosphoesterase [Psychrobacter sp. JCM 18903]|nr:calcineurin-like phosphoesterase [Psychrobacter sp. JCM 18903]
MATLEIVFAMLDANVADAIMGNHEYNALAFATLDPDNSSQYLRSHNDIHTRQHAAFLAEIAFGSERHQYCLIGYTSCLYGLKQTTLVLFMPAGMSIVWRYCSHY